MLFTWACTELPLLKLLHKQPCWLVLLDTCLPRGFPSCFEKDGYFLFPWEFTSYRHVFEFMCHQLQVRPNLFMLFSPTESVLIIILIIIVASSSFELHVCQGLYMVSWHSYNNLLKQCPFYKWGDWCMRGLCALMDLRLKPNHFNLNAQAVHK